MRKVPYLLVAAAISSLAFAAAPSSASPLSSGLATGNTTLPTVNEGLVQKVHGWHCKRKFSNRRGMHRHRRACRHYDDYDDYDDYTYGGYAPYYGGYGPYYGGFGLGVPFFSFHLGDRHHRRHHW
jgi:hypothetical protein